MKKLPSRRSGFVHVEPLESRTLFSAAGHSVIADAASGAAGTSTALKVHAGELGQAVKFTVTEKNAGAGGAPDGSILLTVDGTPYQTLNLSSKNKNAKTITATFTEPAGGGAEPFFWGSHSVTATFTSSSSLATSTTSGSFTVKEPKFHIRKDGLGVAILSVGKGLSLRGQESASVGYTGYLDATGTIFDFSAEHGGFEFESFANPEAVIPGWDQGMVGAKNGSTRVLLIPASLAYGSAGSGSVPANAELVFIITTIGVFPASSNSGGTTL
jgi:hypothetical protein